MPGSGACASGRQAEGAHINQFGATITASQQTEAADHIGGSRSCGGRGASPQSGDWHQQPQAAPPGGCHRQAKLVPAGTAVTGQRPRRTRRRYKWRAGPGRPGARPYRIVVRGSACEAASCTSRSGTPASKLVESNVPTVLNGSARKQADAAPVPADAFDRCFECIKRSSNATTSDASSWHLMQPAADIPAQRMVSGLALLRARLMAMRCSAGSRLSPKRPNVASNAILPI